MTTIIGIIIIVALLGLLWRAAASCPLLQLLACSFGQWADASRGERNRLT